MLGGDVMAGEAAVGLAAVRGGIGEPTDADEAVDRRSVFKCWCAAFASVSGLGFRLRLTRGAFFYAFFFKTIYIQYNNCNRCALTCSSKSNRNTLFS